MNHSACSPRSNVSTASPSGKPGARGSSTTARRSRGDPGRRWPHMSISAMDTDRSGATTGGSARAPVHRGGTRVFRGSTERLPRLRPLRRDDSPETTGCARWRCAPFSPSLCCRKPTAAHATLPSTCEEAVRAPVLPMCGEFRNGPRNVLCSLFGPTSRSATPSRCSPRGTGASTTRFAATSRSSRPS
jgi:hypothetical protein